MKNNDFIKDLHIGEIIKEIALLKGISSKRIAAAIRHEQQNSDKIFHMSDMDVENIIRISFLLEYNILDFIAQKYLSHLSFADNLIETKFCLLKIDIKNRCLITYESFNNCEFLEETHIGQHIRRVANKNDWSLRDIAKKLHCTQSMVNYLYRSKSLKIKTLILISDALQYHFIAELYLSQIAIDSSRSMLGDCLIIVTRQQIRIEDSNNRTDLLSIPI